MNVFRGAFAFIFYILIFLLTFYADIHKHTYGGKRGIEIPVRRSEVYRGIERWVGSQRASERERQID